MARRRSTRSRKKPVDGATIAFIVIAVILFILIICGIVYGCNEDFRNAVDNLEIKT